MKIKQRDLLLLSDSRNVSDLIAYLGTFQKMECSVHYRGSTAPYSIGRIERRYESLKTYDTNISYIRQNLINTNNIYSTNIAKTLNLSWAIY